METRETLEAALATAWDTDTLAVYADHLQAEGDPRGELIALDLQIAATGNTAELAKRRTSLLYAWLGALVPRDNVHATWIGDSLQLGFVQELEFSGVAADGIERLEQALASPAGPYVRRLRMIGRADELEPALAVVARCTHRWLTELSIKGWHEGMIDPDTVAAALRAMPNLRTLELHRPAVISPLSHPAIEELVVHGRDAYVALGDGAQFPAVTRLVVDPCAHDFDEIYGEEFEVDQPAQRLPTIAFPALRRLEISASIELAHQFLREFPPRAHVTALRIPELHSATDREQLVAIVRDMPALEAVEIARGSYYAPPDIPGVRLVRAEVWPWPMQEAAHGVGLRIFMPHAAYGDTVALLDAVLVMERAYETLPAAGRAAWAKLWRALSAPSMTPLAFPARTLANAVESTPGLMQNGWREVREALSSRRPLAADATVTIERCQL